MILEGPGGRSFALVWTEKGLLALEKDEEGGFTRDPDAKTTEEIASVLERLEEAWGPLATVLVAGEEPRRHAVLGAFRGKAGAFAVLADPETGAALLVSVAERGPILVVSEAAVARFREAIAAGGLASDRSVVDALLASTAVRRGRPLEWIATDPVRVVIQEALVGEERLRRVSTGARSDPGTWLAPNGTAPDFARAELAPLAAIGSIVRFERASFSVEAIVPQGALLYSIAVPIDGSNERGWIALARVDGKLETVRDAPLLRRIEAALGGAVFLDSDRGPLGLAGRSA